MWGVDEDGDHWLPNASTGVPLDDAGYFGGLGMPWNSGSFSGSINELGHLAAVAMGPMVLIGLEITGSGSGDVNLSTGSVWVPGTDDVSGGARRWATPAVSLSDGTPYYLYVDPAQSTIQFTATKATAYGAGMLPLYLIEMDAGSILTSVDLAYRAGSLHKRGIVTVSSGAADSPSSNFTDLQAAFDYLDYMMDQDSARYPGVELWILDDIDVGTSAAKTGENVDGLTVRGMSQRGGAGRTKLYYGDSCVDDACIIIEADDVAFVNILFESQHTGAGTDTSCVRQGYSPARVVARPRFIGCQFTSSNTNLAYGLRGHTSSSWTAGIVQDCEFDLTGTGPTNVAAIAYGGDDWRLTDCVINGVNTDTLISYPGTQLQHSVFTRCEFNNLYQTNISQDSSNWDIQAKFIGCNGELGQIENGWFLGCEFTATSIVPQGNYDVVTYIGGQLKGDDTIQKDYATARVTLIGVDIVPGNNYLIGGTNPDDIIMTDCTIIGASNLLSGDEPITLGNDCLLSGNKIGPFRTSTSQNYSFINITGDSTQVINNLIDASYYTNAVYVASGADRVRITGNDITNPTANTTGGASGVHLAGNESIVQGNIIRSIGDVTDGGIGVYVNQSDYHAIIGNVIKLIEGAAVHLTNSATYNTVVGNTINDVGLATQTNPLVGAVSNNAIEMSASDLNVISNNSIVTVVNLGIHLGSGGQDNAINGNTITGSSGADGITLDSTSTNNTCQLNNTAQGVTDNGTTNLVAASATNNNI
jgi:hypothetical protein